MSSLKGHDRTAIVTESVRNPITWFAIFRHSAAFCVAEDDFWQTVMFLPFQPILRY